MTTRATAPDAETLWREMRGPLASFVTRRVADPSDAEDVVQEVMLRIHRHGDEIERVENLSGWVHQVARSAIVDFYRRRAAQRESPAHDVDAFEETLVAESEEDGESLDARTELAACLSPMIARLSHKYREALELTQTTSQVEAARQLGLSTSGMKARTQRARGQLRELLLECCHVELDRRGGVATYESRPDGCSRCGEEGGACC